MKNIKIHLNIKILYQQQYDWYQSKFTLKWKLKFIVSIYYQIEIAINTSDIDTESTLILKIKE